MADIAGALVDAGAKRLEGTGGRYFFICTSAVADLVGTLVDVGAKHPEGTSGRYLFIWKSC